MGQSSVNAKQMITPTRIIRSSYRSEVVLSLEVRRKLVVAAWLGLIDGRLRAWFYHTSTTEPSSTSAALPISAPATIPSGQLASLPNWKTAAPSSTPSRSPTMKARKPPNSTTAPAIRLRSMRSNGLRSDLGKRAVFAKLIRTTTVRAAKISELDNRLWQTE
jgi:hypothetical protein